MPDLPPRPETPHNAAFRREFYRRWGKENAIICGAARRAEYAVFRQTLSIKCVSAGREHYRVDGRRLTVSDESWLVLNEGREYGSVLEAPQDAFSFCIFFRPGMASEVLGAARLDAAAALDRGGESSPAPVEFPENLRRHDRSVTPVIAFIRRQVQRGLDDPEWYEEQFTFLLERLLRAHRRSARLPERLECVRPSTRAELMKRLGWATDYMHSNLHSPVTLADAARAARLSNYHFLRLFRQVHGVTPMSYLRAQRTERALALLRSANIGVAEAAAQSGLSRLALWRCVRRLRGEAPMQLRGRGELWSVPT